jgi:hypothetical protein
MKATEAQLSFASPAFDRSTYRIRDPRPEILCSVFDDYQMRIGITLYFFAQESHAAAKAAFLDRVSLDGKGIGTCPEVDFA